MSFSAWSMLDSSSLRAERLDCAVEYDDSAVSVSTDASGTFEVLALSASICDLTEMSSLESLIALRYPSSPLYPERNSFQEYYR